MRLSILLLLPILAATPAAAEDLPRFDINLFCQVNAAGRGGLAPCRRDEEGKRVTLSRSWETFPKQRKHFCVQSVSFKPRDQRSYVVLAGCLTDELSS